MARGRLHSRNTPVEGPLWTDARRREAQDLLDKGFKLEPPSRFRFVDLFAGIGGFRIGFESIGGECVFTSEIDPYAVKTYVENFRPSHTVTGDIRPVSANDLPEFDVLTAGFPCQPFSIAGVSKKNALGQPHGFDCKTQGTLFYEIERILEARRPAAFLLENVKNLLAHDKGRTFAVIHEVLTGKLGYHVEVRVIDARHFVPQHRERVLIAGFRKPSTFDFDGLELPTGGPRLSVILQPAASVDRKYTLSGHLWRYLRAYAKRHKAAGNGFGFGLVGPDDVARTLSARYYKDGSEILVKRGRGNPRRLTPRECARLMGFDRPGRTRFKIPVSDTRAYKQFGNAVVVPVVEHVARFMAPHIGFAMQVVASEAGTTAPNGRRLLAAKT